MAETTVDKVADYILWFNHHIGGLITNLKLQKMVYYAQAWYLALYNKALFDDDFEAWVHGPVQPHLYQRFKKFRWDPIGYNPPYIDLPEHIKEHIKEVMEVFSDYSAYTLEKMVHNEAPWRNARRGLLHDEPSNNIISKDDMRDFYKKLSNEGKEE
jgi:uncharacterized phage-associated protein